MDQNLTKVYRTGDQIEGFTSHNDDHGLPVLQTCIESNGMHKVIAYLTSLLRKCLLSVVETNNSGLTLIIIRIYYLITLIVDMLSPQSKVTTKLFSQIPSHQRFEEQFSGSQGYNWQRC